VLLTSRGIYALHSSKPDAGYTIKNYLLKISVNERDTSCLEELVLPNDKNSINFSLSAPFYTNPEKIYFKYRLVGSADDSWRLGQNGEREFRFSSLRHGKYIFEAVAIHPQFGMAEKPIIFPFTIRPAWHETWVFKIAISLFIASVIILLVSTFFNYRFKQQKIDFAKQLAVQNERQRISAEIHDDIGAGLSGVRLLTELTSNKTASNETKEDLGKIYSSITELSSKMQEVIWSLNPSNDTLENLLQYIQQKTGQLLEHSPIKLVVSMPHRIPEIEIQSDVRTDIYLSVKEALHNALKHSGAKKIELNFAIASDCLLVSVSDDGKGLAGSGNKGNGMQNMKKRTERLQGTMVIKDQNGVTIQFSFPFNLIK
jgi:signal transduction histidine kinase